VETDFELLGMTFVAAQLRSAIQMSELIRNARQEGRTLAPDEYKAALSIDSDARDNLVAAIEQARAEGR
jgi:hypothetical protein